MNLQTNVDEMGETNVDPRFSIDQKKKKIKSTGPHSQQIIIKLQILF